MEAEFRVHRGVFNEHSVFTNKTGEIPPKTSRFNSQIPRGSTHGRNMKDRRELSEKEEAKMVQSF